MSIYTEDTIVKIAYFHYATNELLVVEEMTIQSHTGIPAFSTEVLPKGNKDGYAQVFDQKNQKWEYVEDYRNKKCYSTENGAEIEVNELGKLPKSVTDQERPNVFAKWNGKTWVTDLEKAKEAKREEINNARTNAELSGFVYENKPFDSDRDSISRISNAAITAQSTLLMQQPFNVAWTLMDNSVMQLDAKGVLGMQSAMVQNVDAINTKSRELKLKIDDAKSIEELEEITWNE